MRIIIIGQEEPEYFSPFLRKIIEARQEDIALVVIAGNRGAGNHPKTWLQVIKSAYSLWRLFEIKGLLKIINIRFFHKFLSLFGLIGSKYDKRSIIGIAKEKEIPYISSDNLNDPKFLEILKSHEPDVIINQTESLLKKPFLAIPKIGVINRHASLLPRYRGRLGSFWGHAQEPAEYGTTIHFVDEHIDSGKIIIQQKHDLDPCLSYGEILQQLFNLAIPLMLEALERLESPSFIPLPNDYKKTPSYKFPSLEKIQSYRKTLKKRRQKSSSSKKHS